MYADYLREHAIEVTEVPSTDTAVALAHLHHVIVTGLNVPGTITVPELIGRVRALGTGHGIVVVTASSRRDQHEAAWRAGCDCLLLKPCLPTELLEMVQRVAADAEHAELQQGHLSSRR
jgi:CheY-like chemotaxis protein